MEKYPVSERADIFYKIADNLEKDSTKFLYYLIHEAGKHTDSMMKLGGSRFLRYYADNAKSLLSEPNNLNGQQVNLISFSTSQRYFCASAMNFRLPFLQAK